MLYSFDINTDRTGTGSIKYDLREKVFGNEEVIPLWVADMDFETPYFIREALEARLKHPILGYTLREDKYYDTIIKWLYDKHGWIAHKDWFVFTPGIVPALNFSTLAFTNPGDKIIVQPPVYFPFFTAVNDHNRVLVENQLLYENNKYRINFEQLKEQAKDASMLLLSNPHNPVGRVWTKEELIQIGEICLENNVVIISDEIHSDLILPGYNHVPLASVSEDIARITVTCVAPSKTFNMAGLSTSSVIISDSYLRKKFLDVVEKLHLVHGNIFGVEASQAGYAKGRQWVDDLMEYINGNFRLLDDMLTSANSMIKLVKPEATYLGWLDFSATGLSDVEIKHRLINRAGVGLSHGPDFGNGGQGFQRINVASPRSVIEEAVKRMLEVDY